MRKRNILLGILLLCAVIAGIQCLRARQAVPETLERHPSGPSSAGGGEPSKPLLNRGGISFQPGDSASLAFRGGWFVGNGQALAHLADESEDLSLKVIKQPDSELFELERWMIGQTSDRVLVNTYQCSRQHLKGFTRTCRFRLRAVIERTDADKGRIVYAKSTSEEMLERECQAYSDCVARSAYLGGEVPMPPSLGQTLAVHQDSTMSPFEGTREEYQAVMRTELERSRAEYEQMLEDPEHDPRTLEQYELLIKFLELRKDDG